MPTYGSQEISPTVGFDPVSEFFSTFLKFDKDLRLSVGELMARKLKKKTQWSWFCNTAIFAERSIHLCTAGQKCNPHVT